MIEIKFEDWPIEQNAGFRMSHCYRCHKLEMIDRRGLFLNCYIELVPNLEEELKNLQERRGITNIS